MITNPIFRLFSFYMCELFVGIRITVHTLLVVGVGVAEPLGLDKYSLFMAQNVTSKSCENPR